MDRFGNGSKWVILYKLVGVELTSTCQLVCQI